MLKKFVQHVWLALMLLVGIAVVTRVSYELLAPMVPLLLVLVILSVIYALMFGRGRR
jgi:cell division protein FtsW (lipid II flippase)